MSDTSPKVLMVFTSANCAPCKVYKPVAVKVCEALQVRLAEMVVADEPAWATQLAIRAAPTSVLFVHGMEIRRHVGVMTEAKLTEFIQS